ncbi:MAG: radical SAM protein [Dehalococcoidia bacterium]
MSKEKRYITKEDILVKARMHSEGVRLPVHAAMVTGPNIVLDGCDLVMYTRRNPRSRLQMSIDGEDISIAYEGEVLVTGRVQERLPWLDTLLSDGTPVGVAANVAGHTDINISFLHTPCYNRVMGKACRYCRKCAEDMPDGSLVEYAMRQAEGLKVATDNGWRGTVFVFGGGLPPELPRDRVLRLLETVLTPIRDTLDSKVLSELNVVLNNYPPDDFKEMETWRDLGISATSFDLEVMDPAYFAAVCPGKSLYARPQEHWKEAQIASTEIFGPGRGTLTNLVLGMEPMETLLAGVDERLSHGVFPVPFGFVPGPGMAFESFRPPTAEWHVEVAEQIVDSILQHADKLGMDPMADRRAGMTRTGLSYPAMLIGDEITRRAQERGVFPAGLPRQDCAEPRA